MNRLIAALALTLAATAASAQEAASLYQQRCAMCHGKDGKGSPAGLKMGAPDLTTVKDSEQQIAGVIANGKGKMTAFKGKLSDAQIQALAKFVKAGLK